MRSSDTSGVVSARGRGTWGLDLVTDGTHFVDISRLYSVYSLLTLSDTQFYVIVLSKTGLGV